MVSIRQVECPTTKTSIKCPYTMEAEEIAVHNTANDASAENEIAYMHSNVKQVSFHVAVDDKEIIQGIDFNRNAWHAGDGGSGRGNRKAIAIEICYSKSGGERFAKAQENAAEYIASLLKERNWGIEKVKKHQDYSGKHCPHRTLDEYGWDFFINLVKKYMGSTATETEMYRVRKTWNDASSQIGAYTVLDNAIKNCKEGYFVFDSNGVIIYPIKETPVEPVKKSVEEIAAEVMAGKWGNGDARKQALIEAGYDYAVIQVAVNKLVEGNQTTPTPVKKSNAEIAKEVLDGKWGNGDDRKNRLIAAGYNYADVQAEVNKLSQPVTIKKTNTELVQEVLAGKWGTGEERKKKLTAAGYDYNLVQAEVNKLIKSETVTPAKKSNKEIAKEVLAGKWGNGEARKKRLTDAGYNPSEIQKIVNQLAK